MELERFIVLQVRYMTLQVACIGYIRTGLWHSVFIDYISPHFHTFIKIYLLSKLLYRSLISNFFIWVSTSKATRLFIRLSSI